MHSRLSNISNYETWFRPYDWRCFCTFAFDKPVGRDCACRIFRHWIEMMERRENYPITWVRVLERGAFRVPEGEPHTGRWHVHALFAGIHRRINPYITLWEEELGDVDIDDFDKELNGIAYILKSLSGNEYDIDFDLHPQHLRQQFRRASSRTSRRRQVERK